MQKIYWAEALGSETTWYISEYYNTWKKINANLKMWVVLYFWWTKEYVLYFMDTAHKYFVYKHKFLHLYIFGCHSSVSSCLQVYKVAIRAQFENVTNLEAPGDDFQYCIKVNIDSYWWNIFYCFWDKWCIGILYIYVYGICVIVISALVLCL